MMNVKPVRTYGVNDTGDMDLLSSWYCKSKNPRPDNQACVRCLSYKEVSWKNFTLDGNVVIIMIYETL